MVWRLWIRRKSTRDSDVDETVWTVDELLQIEDAIRRQCGRKD